MNDTPYQQNYRKRKRGLGYTFLYRVAVPEKYKTEVMDRVYEVRRLWESSSEYEKLKNGQSEG